MTVIRVQGPEKRRHVVLYHQHHEGPKTPWSARCFDEAREARAFARGVMAAGGHVEGLYLDALRLPPTDGEESA